MLPVSTSSPILRGEVLADAGDARAAPRAVRSAIGVPQVDDRLGGVAVGADLERVLALDLEEIADLGQDARDARGCPLAVPTTLQLARSCRSSGVSTRSRPSGLDAEDRARGRRCAARRRADGRDRCVGLADAEQAAAAAGAADLAAERAGRARRREHARRSRAWSRPARGRLRFSHSAATCRPDRRSSRCRSSAARISTAMSRMRAKRSLDDAVAVDVALHHVPVVDAGVARRVRCRRARAAIRARRGRPSAATRRMPSDAQLDRGDPAVVGRPIVLHAGRHVDHLRLDVHRDLQELRRPSRSRSLQAASAPQTAMFRAEDPAMPAPTGESERVRSSSPSAWK